MLQAQFAFCFTAAGANPATLSSLPLSTGNHQLCSRSARHPVPSAVQNRQKISQTQLDQPWPSIDPSSSQTQLRQQFEAHFWRARISAQLTGYTRATQHDWRASVNFPSLRSLTADLPNFQAHIRQRKWLVQATTHAIFAVHPFAPSHFACHTHQPSVSILSSQR
jgi:hypothetical protein